MPPAPRNHKTEDTVIILAAHGSTRRPAANETIETHAARMRAGGPFKDVRAAFLLGDTAPADTAREIDAALVPRRYDRRHWPRHSRRAPRTTYGCTQSVCSRISCLRMRTCVYPCVCAGTHINTCQHSRVCVYAFV